MSTEEIIEILAAKNFQSIEVFDGCISADFGLGEGEYWILVFPDQGGWLRVVLQESGSGETLSDRLWESLENAIAHLHILITIDYVQYHDWVAVQLPR